MHPEEGVILVNGKRVGRDVDMPEDIGAIIEAPGFLPNYSGYKNLRFGEHTAKDRQGRDFECAEDGGA